MLQPPTTYYFTDDYDTLEFESNNYEYLFSYFVWFYCKNGDSQLFLF